MPEIEDFLNEVFNQVETAQKMKLRDEINEKTPFDAQGAQTKLYTIDTDTKSVFITFMVKYNEGSEMESKIRRHLDRQIGKPALIVF